MQFSTSVALAAVTFFAGQSLAANCFFSDSTDDADLIPCTKSTEYMVDKWTCGPYGAMLISSTETTPISPPDVGTSLLLLPAATTKAPDGECFVRQELNT
ncbi:hypothetical protein E4U42_006883 [Claviceps africana]|uniref:Uncharacterized protein n=1 Tax=Claviceps africana TaxID=83212 RepID=A0A8K0NET1_9HYPO|nr:hypothetical protein E4U42_006883 [Claviceps africana]